MVIAHVLSSFQVGGQERVALDLAVRQQARGHRVMAVSLAPPPDGPLAGELVGAGIAAHTVPKRGPSVDPTLPMRLASLLRRQGVEVVHAHNPQPLIYGSIAAKLTGAAMIQTRHGVAHHSDRQDWLVRQATRLVDASVFVSRELATSLGGAGQRPGRSWVIENGVDLTRFFPDPAARTAVRRELGLPEDALVVGTVSRLVQSKNVPGLVRAMWPILGEKEHLVVVGDGPARQDVEQMVVFTPKAASVHVLGARADVARLLRAFDLFVLFSRTEGHPIVVLEAMATALPVLATPVGGIPGIIDDGETGFLVPTDDEEALQGKLIELLSSPRRLAEVGWRARAVALERYAADRMVDEYLALYARWGKGLLGMLGAALICLAILAYTYVGYPLVIGALARLRPRPTRAHRDWEPTVTACIAAYNVADTIEAKLKSLTEQAYPAMKVEILVYSDGSTDGTERVVEACVARDPRIRLIRGQRRMGKPTGLNRMREVARGQVLLITDARQPLAPGALRALLDLLGDLGVGCVTGNLVLKGSAGSGVYWRYENWIRRQEARFRSVVGMTGPLAALRKSDLDLLPPDLILDDIWIPMRLRLRGRRVLFSEQAMAYDQAFDDAREFGRKVRTLAGNYQIFARMPALLSPLANPSWFETVSHKVMRLVCPWALVALLGISLAGLSASDGALGWRLLTAAQLAFYGVALLGRRAGRLAGVARTFLVLHVAALVGLWRFARGTQKVTW